jgi:metal-sulfur cluster biosynthetic enzyme
MLTELDIREALRACYATPPGHTQPVNIVDLGLVDSIAVAVDLDAPGAGIPGVPAKHTVTITLLSAIHNADAQPILAMQIANCLAGLEQVSRTSVYFTDTPIWTSARISAAGRALLQLDFPILNKRVG